MKLWFQEAIICYLFYQIGCPHPNSNIKMECI